MVDLKSGLSSCYVFFVELTPLPGITPSRVLTPPVKDSGRCIRAGS